MTSNLYTRDQYVAQVPMVVSSYIREYDMSQANLSVIKRLAMMPESEIEHLRLSNKSKREKLVGWFLRNHPEHKKPFAQEFVKIRKEFFEANDIEDKDVFSIKKDAIFLINKPASVVDFNHVHFALKNVYTSYFYLDGNEFYFRKHLRQIDVKGIKDELLELHRDYMLRALGEIFVYVENGNQKRIFDYLYDFRTDYINRTLPVGYYRELNRQSLYRLTGLQLMHNDIGVVDIDEWMISKIDTSYNYMHYIVPLIRLLI